MSSVCPEVFVKWVYRTHLFWLPFKADHHWYCDRWRCIPGRNGMERSTKVAQGYG